ncbi:MAG: class I SAM-dependent methyltransferase [Bacteroidetes bacterium]|nr:class I SAM-dependent methyltransferase [Bacteroidota bacterium]
MNLSNQSNPQFSEAIKKSRRNFFAKKMNQKDTALSNNFMNYGFKNLSADEEINLLHDDEKNRYFIQLYDHVISKVDLYYKDILEVSSGRGGGASYINRYYAPKTYTGVESSKNLINFCNSYYDEPGLSFIKASEKKIPFSSESFDVLINIGAARFYDDFPKFCNEVYRVLRKDSIFIFADIIEKRYLETVKHQLRMAGFTIEYKDDITKNITAFIEDEPIHDYSFKKERIPGFMKKAFSPFIKNHDPDSSESLLNGNAVFMSYILKKVS